MISFNGAEARSLNYADRERFLNMRAASHWKLRELLESNRITLLRNAALEEEGLAVEWQLTQNEGKIQMLSRDTMRATLGRSPDRLDAVVMALAHSVGGMMGHTTVTSVRL